MLSQATKYPTKNSFAVLALKQACFCYKRNNSCNDTESQTRLFIIRRGGRFPIKSNSSYLSGHKHNECCRTALSYKQGNIHDRRHGR